MTQIYIKDYLDEMIEPEYMYDFYNMTRYVDDELREYAGQLVDIYEYELDKWIRGSAMAWEYIIRAHEELGATLDDKYGLIRDAQYLYYLDELYNQLNSILEYLFITELEEKITTIDDECMEDIPCYLKNVSRFEDIEDKVKEFIEDNKEYIDCSI